MRPCDGEPQPVCSFIVLLMLSGILNPAIMVVVTGSGRVPSLIMSPWSGQPSVMLQGKVCSSSILLLLKPLILLYFSGGAGLCSMVRWGCIEGVSSLTRAHRQLRHVSGDQHHHLVGPWGGVNGKFKLILKHSLCVTLRSGDGSRIVEV